MESDAHFNAILDPTDTWDDLSDDGWEDDDEVASTAPGLYLPNGEINPGFSGMSTRIQLVEACRIIDKFGPTDMLFHGNTIRVSVRGYIVGSHRFTEIISPERAITIANAISSMENMTTEELTSVADASLASETAAEAAMMDRGCPPLVGAVASTETSFLEEVNDAFPHISVVETVFLPVRDMSPDKITECFSRRCIGAWRADVIRAKAYTRVHSRLASAILYLRGVRRMDYPTSWDINPRRLRPIAVSLPSPEDEVPPDRVRTIGDSSPRSGRMRRQAYDCFVRSNPVQYWTRRDIIHGAGWKPAIWPLPTSSDYFWRGRDHVPAYPNLY